MASSETSAELEDCMTLAVDRYTADELWEIGLRLVSAAGGRPVERLGDAGMPDQQEER
jgi:hypothetical protein